MNSVLGNAGSPIIGVIEGASRRFVGATAGQQRPHRLPRATPSAQVSGSIFQSSGKMTLLQTRLGLRRQGFPPAALARQRRYPVGTSQDDRSIMAIGITHRPSGIMLHMAFSLVAVLWASLSGTVALSEEPPEDPPKSAGIVLFDEQVQPVLVQHCYQCHSSEREEPGGGLELDSAMGIRSGGNSGPILVSHDVNQSLLLEVLRNANANTDSSALSHHQLPNEVVSAFEEWIRLGARLSPTGRIDLWRTAP